MKHLLFLPIFLFGLSVAAQDHPVQYAKYEQDVFQRFDNFTMKNGLPCNTIRKIFQDRDGFIWLATDNGLSRYDGSRFVNFLPKDGDSLSLSNREVTSIAQTKDGYIWVGTKDGLNRLDPTTGVFRQYRVKNAPFMRDNYIRALLVSSDGQLWFDCVNGTLTQFNPVNHKFLHFYSQGNAWADYFEHVLFETSNKKIWAAGMGFHLRQYDMNTNQFTTIKDTTCKVHGGLGCIADLWQDAQSYIWVANAASPSLLYSPKTKRFVGIQKLTGIYAIRGDNFGNIWFGGYYSTLFKYNPKKNTVTYYEHSDINTQSRLGGQIYTLLCDRSGVMWIGSEKGLSRLSPYKGKFPLYRHIPDAASPKSSSISTVFQDSDGDIWFGTDNSAVFSYSPKNNLYRNFTHERNNPNTIGSSHVTAIAQDKQGTLWFTLWGGVGGAINSLNKKSGVAKRFNTMDNYYWYSDIDIKNDSIIVGSWGTGVDIFDRRQNDYVKLYTQHSMGFARDFGGFRSIAADGDGNIWFKSNMMSCSYNTSKKNYTGYFPKESSMSSYYRLIKKEFKGTSTNLDFGSGFSYYIRDTKGTVWEVSSTIISELNKKNNRFKSYKIKGEVISSTTSNSFNGSGFWLGGANRIVHFSIDSKSAVEFKTNIPIGNVCTTAEVEENLLVVGGSTGLYVGKVLIKNSTINFHQIDSIPFSTSCRLDNGELLLGSSKGLFVLNNTYSTLKRIVGEGSNSVIHAMHSINGRDVYIGIDNGLLLYQTNRGIVRWWKPNPNIKNQLFDDIVCSITQTTDGTVWLGTNKGYSKLNPDNLTFTNYFNDLNDALTSDLISRVYTDSKGYTWAGTTGGNGINRINSKSGYIDNYRHFPWDSTSICKGDINDIHETSNGTIWIGTETGLCKFMPQTNSFINYDMNAGLGSNTILAIQEDSSGNLWMSTQAGLSRFNPKTLQSINYTWKDGLQGGVFSRMCATKLKDGRLVFGGNEGYNMFYPDSIRMNPHSPLPIITSVSVNGKVSYISSPKEINLSFDERNIEISISSSDYNFPENNQLAYKLEGFDQEFKSATTGQPAVYTNLLPGDYRFILQVTNNDGKWCKSPLVLYIRVGYPVWLRWWALFLEVTAIFGLVILAIKFRLKSITLQKKLLEKEIAQQTERLRLKNEEITTHHDVLVSQKEHIQKLYNEQSNSIEYVELIQQANLLTGVQRESILGLNFLLSLPKDKLSGDFFWAQKYQDKAIFMLADCMLHGLPGAILSMVGISIIKEISIPHACCSPDETLKILHQRIKEYSASNYQHKHPLNNIEIGCCVLDRSSMKIAFSGKQIDLYISRIENGERHILECKSTPKQVDNSFHLEGYNLIEQHVMPDDYLYMFSDGLVNQLNLSATEDSNNPQLMQLLEYLVNYPFEMHETLILEKFYGLKGITDQKDDITILGVKI